jgi:hypothetical protein
MNFNQLFQVEKSHGVGLNFRSAVGAERRLKLESVDGSDQRDPWKLFGRRLVRHETNRSLKIDSRKVPSQTRQSWEYLGRGCWLPWRPTCGQSVPQNIGVERFAAGFIVP